MERSCTTCGEIYEQDHICIWIDPHKKMQDDIEDLKEECHKLALLLRRLEERLERHLEP